jgi:hypothetical protein
MYNHTSWMALTLLASVQFSQAALTKDQQSLLFVQDNSAKLKWLDFELFRPFAIEGQQSHSFSGQSRYICSGNVCDVEYTVVFASTR